jgi:hypothetical protein
MMVGMQGSQRWGLAAVLALAIAAIAFVFVQYDHFSGVCAIPLALALAVTIAAPQYASKVTIIAGGVSLVIAIVYMGWAGAHRDEIADAHAATRGVQIALAVSGLALLTGRAAGMQQPQRASAADHAHKQTDAIQLPQTGAIPKP